MGVCNYLRSMFMLPMLFRDPLGADTSTQVHDGVVVSGRM